VGQSSLLAGSAARSGAVLSHDATGAIVGPGASISGASNRTRAISSSGALIGPSALLAGSATRSGAVVSHATSGTLSGQIGSIAGVAVHKSLHTSSGAIVGQLGSLSATATRISSVVTPTKLGGDDAFHHNKHTGWNKKTWQKKQLREDAIESTIEATYQQLMGFVPAPAVVAEIKREAKAEIHRIDYTQERKFIDWLSAEIQSIRDIQSDIEDDDEEAMMLLMG
jgi:hypothetical protein